MTERSLWILLAAWRGAWQHGRVDYALAQVNIVRLLEPLDSPRLAGFAAALDLPV